MACVIDFPFPLPNGLHARPASSLEEAVRPFVSTVRFANRRNGREADARSVLALIATETRSGDPCALHIAGSDEAAARGGLADFLKRVFPDCDEALDRAAAVRPAPTVPRSLLAAGLDACHAGQVVCGGLGWGRLRVYAEPLAASAAAPAGSGAAEAARFEAAVQAVEADLRYSLQRVDGTAAAILKVHLALLRDPAFARAVEARIAGGAAATGAITGAIDEFGTPLRSSADLRLRERVLDVEELGGRLIEKLGGPAVALPVLAEATILAALNLSPGRLLDLDRRNLQGLVLGPAGATSHTAILARSFGIPTLAGLAAALPSLVAGEEAIVDGQLGLLVLRPTEGVWRFYHREQVRLAALQAKRAAAGVHRGGRQIEIGANVSTLREVPAAFALGAEGIGLFRTEMIGLSGAAAPTEDEYHNIFAEAVRAAGGRTVIIRTLDIGGDKPAGYLHLPRETNPFLGVRGVRWYEAHAPIVTALLRAAARAAADGPLKLLVPMIAEVAELRLCRRLLEGAKAELRVRGARFAETIPLGAMLEVPAAAFAMDALCAEADFFSVGTNDLAQYFFAAARDNPAVNDRRRCFQPAFLRLVQGLVNTAHRHGRWVGLCGDWAEDPAALPLLIGLGLDEISVAGPHLAAVKAAAGPLDPVACANVLAEALVAESADAVIARAREALGGRSAAALVTPELVILDSTSRTKEEAIRELAGALQLAGRTDQPEAIEARVWERESVYSTGFGDGVALPHCQSDALGASALAVLRLREPVPWQSLDGRPVDLAILLAVRAADHGKEHLAAIGRFSRLLMRDEFRERLRAEADPARLAAFILSQLDPAQA